MFQLYIGVCLNCPRDHENASILYTRNNIYTLHVKCIHITFKMAHPSRALTTMHAYKKRKTYKAQHQEVANNSRAN